MATAKSICMRAMSLAGVLAAGETPTADDLNDTLASLNSMLGSWTTERFFVYVLKEEIFSLTPGKQEYIIGTDTSVVTPDFLTVRPQWISETSFIRTGGMDYPVIILNDQEYESITMKNLGGALQFCLYYRTTYPNGQIFFWPVPPTGELHLFSWKPLGEFSALNDEFVFPPGYQRAVEYSLAEEIEALFNLTVPPSVHQIAAKARRNIKRMNVPTLYMQFPGELTDPRRFNIYSGYPY